jgi:glycerophosphoryl diester phosphodiesterase
MPIPPLFLRLGHRGVRGNELTPENTLTAFDLALSEGCDGFEFDVRLSADGQAVICHDANYRGLEVAKTSAQALALLLLRDVLMRYQRTAFLDIELKVAGLEGITLDLLRAYPPSYGYVVSSFLPEVLRAIRSLDATIPLGLICETRSEFALWSSLPVQYVIPHHKLIRRSTIAELKDKGCKVIVWTVNSATGMKRFAEWGVDGIISDSPGKLALLLGHQVSPQE